MRGVDAPLALLAELTHRCPLQCPYCSNPLELERARAEIDTVTWARIIDEAAALGILQIHFSGGEPTARRDLPELVRRASRTGLYTNLITSGVLLDEQRIAELAEAGLQHVQISFQDVDDAEGDRIAGYRDAQRRKRLAAAWVRAAGLPLTLNAVMHRWNLERLPQMIELAVALGAGRLEVAHVQYYGWGLLNRAALLPSRAQLETATEIVEQARSRLKGELVIDYVVPDYHAALPKACMGGWGQRFLNVTPAGKVLPCHAAETLPGLRFPTVYEASLREIWYDSEIFNRFRGTDWMAEPCRSCERRDIDWGGCRCQAFALTGDASATDPVCHRSADRTAIEAAIREADGEMPDLVYRRIGRESSPSRREAAATTPRE